MNPPVAKTLAKSTPPVLKAGWDTALRPGNKALEHLLTYFQPCSTETQKVVDLLPGIARSLYSHAQGSAAGFLRGFDRRRPGFWVRRLFGFVSGATARKNAALTNSIFDLQLTAVFEELSKYTGNSGIATLLVDALVYEATGLEAGYPSPEELLYLGTEKVRGIGKFYMARQDVHPDGGAGFTFGREFAAIVQHPMDIAYTGVGAFFSFRVRVRARWIIRFLLFGTRPTKDEEAALEKLEAHGLPQINR